MCGIVGFTGMQPAAPVLLDGLSKLEYRGYDQRDWLSGMEAATWKIIKARGRLRVLAEKTNNGAGLLPEPAAWDIRWATHGEPSEANAHPHCSR